jgi:hypothetical protein
MDTASDEARKAKAREAHKRRCQDPAYRERIRENQRRHYLKVKNSPAYADVLARKRANLRAKRGDDTRTKESKYRKEKYARDPDYRELIRERGRKYRARRIEETPREYKLGYYKSGARKRGYEWGITDEEAYALFDQACFYCTKAPDPINGIDRVFNEKGYTGDNKLLPCCTRCNYAKSDETATAFEEWATRFATTWLGGGREKYMALMQARVQQDNCT